MTGGTDDRWPHPLRRLLPRTFQGRLTIAFVGVVALVLLLVSTLVLNRLDDYFRSQQEADLRARNETVSVYVQSVARDVHVRGARGRGRRHPQSGGRPRPVARVAAAVHRGLPGQGRRRHRLRAHRRQPGAGVRAGHRRPLRDAARGAAARRARPARTPSDRNIHAGRIGESNPYALRITLAEPVHVPGDRHRQRRGGPGRHRPARASGSPCSSRRRSRGGSRRRSGG